MKALTRMKDIVASNVNAVLDRVEDPEKLVRLMVQEMEDSLVKMRTTCSEAAAARKRLKDIVRDNSAKGGEWKGRAWRAAKMGRDDLAKDALVEKRQLERMGRDSEREMGELADLHGVLKEEIAEMEESLREVRQRRHLLVERHTKARLGRRVHGVIRRCESAEFPQDVEGYDDEVESEFEYTASNRNEEDAIEKELQKLKSEI